MYNSNSRKTCMLLIAVVMLLCFLVFMESMNGDAARLDRKIQKLGTDRFEIVLYNEGISANENSHIIQEVTVQGWLNDKQDTFYFFMPSVIDPGSFAGWKFLFNNYQWILVDGQMIVPGDVFALEEGEHTLALEDGTEFLLEVLYSENIASMFVELENGSLEEIRNSKNNIAQGNFYIFDDEGKTDKNGVIEDIHSRGNLSFSETDKKSFSVEIQQNASLLGMDESNKWILTANAFDDTLSRNYLTGELAKTLDMDFVLDAEYVDLYIDGEYQGNYQLSEKVEIADGRVEIRDLEKETNNLNVEEDITEAERREIKDERIALLKYANIEYQPADITGGYLLELDMAHRFEDEVSGFLSAGHQPVVMKSPEYAGIDQVSYVAGLYQDMEDALNSEEGFNKNTGKHYYDYMDIHSFAQKYLIDEVTKNTDSSLSSFFIYIPETDGIFHAGPIWDYDKALGADEVRDGISMKDPEGLYAAVDIQLDVCADRAHSLHYMLCEQELFTEEYKNLYFDVMRDAALDIADTEIMKNAVKLEASAVMDVIRWNRFDGMNDREEIKNLYYEKQEEIASFLKKRIEFLDETWQ